MDSNRNTNYGRQPRAFSGRGRVAGRGTTPDYQNPSGGRGRHGMHGGPHRQSPPPQEGAYRAPVWGNRPPVQQAGAYRPPLQQMRPTQPQSGVSAVGDGRGGAWTGRPWGPSASTPPPFAQPPPQSRISPQPPADELGIHKLHISDRKSLPSVSDGKGSQIQAVKRPDRGGRSAVRSVGLLVNHFRVNFDENTSIFHYDVEVKPKLSDDNRAVQRKIRKSDMRLIRDKLFSDDPLVKGLMTAYDGEKNIFSPRRLPEGQFTVDISAGEDTRSGSYVFKIKLVNELKLSKLEDYRRGNLSYVPRDILQGMDLVMKENPSNKRISVGRSFFSHAGAIDLSGGLEACRGLQQSLKLTSQGVALCVDYSMLAFRKPIPVIEFLKAHIQGFQLHDIRKRRREVNGVLMRLRVKVTHRVTNQKYTIAGLTEENACDVYFDMIDPEGKNPQQSISLIKYFEDKWKVKIQHKDIPCLELGKPNRPNKVPLEFCVLVEGQRYPKERLDKRTDKSLKISSLAKPFERKNTISGMVQAPDGPCGGNVATEFGMNVEESMTRLKARVLGPPQLKLGGTTVQVHRETCQWNFVGPKAVVDGKSVEHWGFIEFFDDRHRRNKRDVDEFVTNLRNRSRSLGMYIAEPLARCSARMSDLNSDDNIEYLLRDVIKKSGRGNLELIVCSMTERHAGYKNIKLVAETRIGVVTQCYLSSSPAVQRGDYFANLCLKINAKLGGSNFELNGNLLNLNYDDHVMFIGADVNHPAPGNTECPSIAAVVGSVNWPAANRYAARVLPQTHRCEKIINFGSMCMDLVNQYREHNGVMPKRIVVFRDGVSDAQFEMALGVELCDLKRTFSEQNYNPQITLIVAKKRHLTRLFVENERDGGKSGNVPPGTVVDTTITHPCDFDFYLCSHYGSLGTSKPTHYYVLCNESSFTSDELQKLIYNMCFIFARCTKPVSLVTPVYYADLAAFRGRMYQEAVMGRGSPPDSFDEGIYKMHQKMENAMFFI